MQIRNEILGTRGPDREADDVSDDEPSSPADSAAVPPSTEPVSLVKPTWASPGDQPTDMDATAPVWDAEAQGPWEPDEPDPAPPPVAAPPAVEPPVVATLRFAGQSLTIVALLALGFLLQLTLIGSLQHDRDQAQAFAELRIQLAEGTAPVGPLDQNGVPYEPGTPVGILEIPALGLQEVVLEGPTSRVLMSGPGHQRDTVMPGQMGTSVVLGRRGGYGGPFREIDRLQPGNEIIVTNGQGRHVFSVLGARRAGDALPAPLARGGGRITLVTTNGPVFQPTDILLLDADLTSPAQDRPVQIPRGTAPENEAVLAADSTALLSLMLWGPLLVAAVLGVMWVRHSIGRWHAWTIGIPVIGLFGLLAIDSAAALLPNIL